MHIPPAAFATGSTLNGIAPHAGATSAGAPAPPTLPWYAPTPAVGAPGFAAGSL